jgi:hypothetical protein
MDCVFWWRMELSCFFPEPSCTPIFFPRQACEIRNLFFFPSWGGGRKCWEGIQLSPLVPFSCFFMNASNLVYHHAPPIHETNVAHHETRVGALRLAVRCIASPRKARYNMSKAVSTCTHIVYTETDATRRDVQAGCDRMTADDVNLQQVDCTHLLAFE